jgi:hypothetical protein
MVCNLPLVFPLTRRSHSWISWVYTCVFGYVSGFIFVVGRWEQVDVGDGGVVHLYFFLHAIEHKPLAFIHKVFNLLHRSFFWCQRVGCLDVVHSANVFVAREIERQSRDWILCILIHSFPSFYTCMATVRRGAADEATVRPKGRQVQCTSDHIWILCCNTPSTLEHHTEWILSSKNLMKKNLKMYIINVYAKTPKTL